MGRNGSSLIDYVLVSQNVLDMFTSFCIGDPNIFSDHCVVSFSLLCNRPLEKSQIHDEDFESSTVDSKYEWDKTLLNESVMKLSSSETVNALNTALNSADMGSNIIQADSCINEFVAVIDGVCKPLFEKKVSPIRQSVSKTKYDEICDLNRLIFLYFYQSSGIVYPIIF